LPAGLKRGTQIEEKEKLFMKGRLHIVILGQINLSEALWEGWSSMEIEMEL
jgi:hypothetical protein